MALTIRTTGVQDYIDGSANIQMLVVGGVDAGKTRSSSFWPRPIYADCENGRASIADRKVAYAEIKTSQDMLDLLAHLKGLERTPRAERVYQTLIVDTLDAFQRRVKTEWIEQTKSSSFTGFDAWGYLETKMQLLLTKLLNLDMNVIINVHYKDKVIKDGDHETHQTMLQLQGDLKDNLAQDFDLVGWMGTYWAAEGGERVEKRGITFKKTPDRPFLKDRFGVMPQWLPITFTDEDYGRIFERLLSRLDNLESSQVVEEIPTTSGVLVPNAFVVAPTGGPIPGAVPQEVPLTSHDKQGLAKIAKDLGLTTTVDGQPFRANTLKGEYLKAIETHQANQLAAPSEPTTDASSASLDVPQEGLAETVVETPETPALETGAPATPVEDAHGHDSTVTNVLEALGGEVVSETAPAEDVSVTTSTVETPAESTSTEACEYDGCQVDLGGESPDYVKLSIIKFKKKYCKAHYFELKEKV